MIAYHGTSKEAGDQITQGNSYRSSHGDHHWLGSGVYFFVDGIFSESPSRDAKNWAIVEAYKKKYTIYVVIKNLIDGSANVWDLSSEDGAKLFRHVKQNIKSKINNHETQRLQKPHPSDGIVINFAFDEVDLVKTVYNIVKNNLYMKLSKAERRFKVRYAQPNCTALAVRDIKLIKIEKICEEGVCK